MKGTKSVPLFSAKKASATRKRVMLEALEEQLRLREADEAADFVVSVDAKKVARSVRMWMSLKNNDREYQLLLKRGKVFESRKLGKLLRLAVVHDALDVFCFDDGKKKENVMKKPAAWRNVLGELELKRKALMLACLLSAAVEREALVDERSVFLKMFDAVAEKMEVCEKMEELLRRRLRKTYLYGC